MLKKVMDHLGREITYEYPPKRIISICPGITETLYALDLENEIVGRTRYCIYPKEKVMQAKIVGGTKDIDIEIFKQLNPDLIIAEKEENTKAIVEELEQHFPVFVAEIQSVADAFRMIEDVGNITAREQKAISLRDEVQREFSGLAKQGNKLRAAYVIWRNPYMVVGHNTYINSLLESMGFENPFSFSESRYPIVTEEEFRNSQLDYIFLATEPFHFKEKHKKEFLELCPAVKPVIVDGEMFWYGAKMLEAIPYLNTLVIEK